MRDGGMLGLSRAAMQDPALGLRVLGGFVGIPIDAVARVAGWTADIGLVFGMSVEDATDALGQPLSYVSGQPGNEIFVVIRNVGARWSFRDDPLYLQFRGGRLTGWKADWSRNWMWR